MEFLENWQELLAGFLSGMLALIGVVYSLRRESARQLLARARERKTTSTAIQEWYYAKIVDLKNYLYSRCFEVGRLYDMLPENAAYTIDELEILVELQIDAMTGADAPPDLLSGNLATQFSEVEDSGVRGLITILATQTSRFLDADRYSLNEFRAALLLRDPDDYADGELLAQFKGVLKGQLDTNRTILETADEALSSILWENEFISDWQARMEDQVQAVYAKAGLPVKSGTSS